MYPVTVFGTQAKVGIVYLYAVCCMFSGICTYQIESLKVCTVIVHVSIPDIFNHILRFEYNLAPIKKEGVGYFVFSI